ncbi:MAG: hypothetical protein NDF58_06640 [archaeon YNP-LCB-024-027]|jgi:hypothetical protein|nr:hypothetical protein [Candidatus Culexarchaeum yellowstonense]
MKLKYMYIPLIISLGLLAIGFWIVPLTSDIILTLFLVELASTSIFYLTFIVLIPWLQSRNVDLDSVFMCGLAKPPYIHMDEIYIFNLPFMEDEKGEH